MLKSTPDTNSSRNANQTTAATSSSTEGAQGPQIDRGSLFRTVAEARDSQRFLNREGISQREVDKRGHVADTRGLDTDFRQVSVATFGHDSADVRQQTKDMLKTALPELRDAARDGHTIVLDGHTSLVGSVEYNQKLSQRRAEAIRDYLVKAGIPEDKIEIRAHGEKAPLAAEERTRQHEAVNRRVAIHVEKSKAAEAPAVEPTRAPKIDPTPQVEPSSPAPKMVDPMAGKAAEYIDDAFWRDVTSPAPMMVDPMAGKGAPLSPLAPTPEQTNEAGKASQYIDDSFWRDVTSPAPMMVDPMAGKGAPLSPLAPTPEQPNEAGKAEEYINDSFWRDVTSPATPRDVPRLRLVGRPVE